MKHSTTLQRGINEIYRRTFYEINNPGGRPVKSKYKRIRQELPDDRAELATLRPYSNN